MKIADLELTHRGGLVRLSASVALDRVGLNRPERAWFEFPEPYAPYLSESANPLAAGLLALAMALGEDLQIEGSLSPRLALGLQEYQRALAYWFPRQLREAGIFPASLAALPADQAGRACATLFSGGIDSTYTLFSHLPERQPIPHLQVKYALFIHGLDIPLQNQAGYAASLARYTRELARVGVEVIPCATNLRYFSSGLVKWEIAHGGAIIGAGLALEGLLGCLLVPSTFSFSELVPWGSSPLVDYYLSTETLKVSHHGADAHRMDKVAALAQWEPARRFLRVCADPNHPPENGNCGRCEKCLRTMTMLAICGALPDFTTFPGPFGPGEVARWTPHYEAGEVWLPQTWRYARQQGRTAYLLPLALAHLRGQLRALARGLIPPAWFPRLKARVYPYSQDPFNPIHL